MSDEQKAAFINAQVAMFYAEKAIMDAENIERERQGYAPANGPEQYKRLFDQFVGIIGYNAVIGFFSN